MTLKYLQKLYKQHWNMSILYSKGNEYDNILISSDELDEVDINFKRDEKQEVYHLIDELCNKFDFSFYLTFCNIEEFKQFLK